jgi:hypothetical protein
MARLNYLELPVADTARAKAFYAAAFGWSFVDFGPDYAATTSGDTDIGFQADAAERTSAALPVIDVDDLEAALAAVEAAGGVVTKPAFAFPGSRRFHFRDPDGHELAAVEAAGHVADTVAAWHAYLAAPSEAALSALLAEDVVFRSPAVHTPQVGKAVTLKYLLAAAEVLGGPSFEYRGEWHGERSAVLEFALDLDGVAVHGIDMIAWNEAGLITEFTVMMRPIKGLQAVVPQMAAVLARGG